MIKDQTVQKVMKISEPRTFKAQEYICFEGEPGSEMYIILRGSVGVYVSSAIDTLTKVSRIMTGDFFGEMSIFDNLPRSASCIALKVCRTARLILPCLRRGHHCQQYKKAYP